MIFYKTFQLTERFALQFRGECYNIFNHRKQLILTSNLDTTDERRNIQFGLKPMF